MYEELKHDIDTDYNNSSEDTTKGKVVWSVIGSLFLLIVYQQFLVKKID